MVIVTPEGSREQEDSSLEVLVLQMTVGQMMTMTLLKVTLVMDLEYLSIVEFVISYFVKETR
eukprot:5822204-Amphidinium_carterae.1